MKPRSWQVAAAALRRAGIDEARRNLEVERVKLRIIAREFSSSRDDDNATAEGLTFGLEQQAIRFVEAVAELKRRES